MVITNISRFSKGHKNKLKWVTVFPFTKHSETILAASHEILYTEPDELALLFYIFVIVMNDVKLFEPQRF